MTGKMLGYDGLSYCGTRLGIKPQTFEYAGQSLPSELGVVGFSPWVL